MKPNIKIFIAFLFLVFSGVHQINGQDISLDVQVKFADGELDRPFVVGDEVVIEITATNNTSDRIDILKVVNRIPSNFVVNSSDLTTPPTEFEATFIDIEPGETQIKSSFDYTIISSGSFIVEVDDEDGLYRAETTVEVAPQADLLVKKLIKTPYANDFLSEGAYTGVNEEFQYKILVTNLGEDTASDIEVRDVLSDSLVLIESSLEPSQILSDNEFVWSIDSLLKGESQEIILTVKALSLGTVLNEVFISSSSLLDKNQENNRSGVSIEIRPLYDLSLSKTLIDSTVDLKEGDFAIFRLELTNDNRVDITDEIIVEDQLPVGYELTNESNLPSNLSYDLDSRKLTWILPNGLIKNTSQGVEFPVQIAFDQSDQEYVNTARIVSDQSLDTDNSNDEASAGQKPIDNFDKRDLSFQFILSPTSYGDNRANVGEEITVSVLISNTGDQMIEAGESSSIFLPDGLDLFSYNSNEMTLEEERLSFSLPSIDSGEFVSFEIKFTVLNQESNYNLVGAILIADDVLVNNIDILEIIPIPVTDLAISHQIFNTIDRGGDFYVGDTLRVVVSAKNLGPSETDENIDVESRLPVSLEYLESLPLGDFNALDKIIKWEIDGLGINESREFEYYAVIVDAEDINITSVVETLDTDPQESNNIQIDTGNTANSSVDLSIEQNMISQERLTTDVIVDFEITLKNSGANRAGNVTIANYIPTGLSPVLESLANNATIVGNSIEWSVEDLSPNEERILLFKARLVGPDLDYINRAEITFSDEFDTDSTPGNLGDRVENLEDDESVITLNFVPVAAADTFEVIQNTSSSLNILSNDDFGFDGPANDEAISFEELPENGELSVNDNATPQDNGDDFIVYKSDADYYGSDRFTYRITDANGDFDIAEVILNIQEDIDGDGIAGEKDLDSDNDGILNSVELGRDTDNDGVDDAFDVDSDNDGVFDVVEAQEYFAGHSGVYDDNGVDLVFSGGIDVLIDSDGDGISDLRDLDSDNDGVSDFIENSDLDFNGFSDFKTGSTWEIIFVDINPFLLLDVQNLTTDFDGDLVYNFRDSDDDDDEILTRDEDFNFDGDWSNDDCDSDGYPDYLDVDSCELVFIKGISPNGLNPDFQSFRIEGLANLYPNFSIQIVNRWGKQVYRYKHNGDPKAEPIWWNGYDSKGDKLPSETYYYILDFNEGNKKPRKDWIYLKW